ncbi:hypothetical protein RCC89_13840 [Cytophagaceae bacterium ABcell3]|nr:hypothetical protein RCC89_13840 [Cytophagaceae bacterium ABcell3]
MKVKLYLLSFLLLTGIGATQAQPLAGRESMLLPYSINDTHSPLLADAANLKVNSSRYGFLLGMHQGRTTFFEFGVQKHWKKVSLKNPRMYAVYGTAAYSFQDRVLGYQAGVWTKKGVDLTYGLNTCYYTDFTGSRFGGGPVVGFRLLGFHLMTGYNFLLGSKEMEEANNLHVTIRYFIPTDIKYKTDQSKERKQKRKEKAKEKERKKKQKEKAKKKKAKEKAKNKGQEPSGLNKLLIKMKLKKAPEPEKKKWYKK